MAVIGALMVLGTWGPAARSAMPEDEEPSQKICEQTVGSFVLVSYHLKKSGRPYIDGSGSDFGQRSVLQDILNHNTMDAAGVILSDRGEVFTVEKEPAHWEIIDHITIKGPDGTVVAAQADRLLVNAPGRILRIEGGLPAGWKPLEFADCGPITPETKLFAVAMGSSEYCHMYVGSCRYAYHWSGVTEGSDSLRISGTFHPAVLCDEQGRPVGVACTGAVDLNPERPIWRGSDILSDPGVSDEQIRQLERRISDEFGKSIYEVRIMPRLDSQEDDEFDYDIPYRFRGRYPGRGAGRERIVFALGFAADKLLIPEALPKDLVARIDTITVMVNDEDVAARFVGVLQDYAGTVIELEKGKLPQTTAFLAERRLSRIEPFWAVCAQDLAGKDVRTEFSRWIDKQQGYADLWYRTTERPIPEGSWLLDRNGRLVGFYADARHESDRLEPYLLGLNRDDYGPYGPSYSMRSRFVTMVGSGIRRGYASNTCLIDAAEMAQILGDVSAHCDPHIRHMDKDEQKRRVWLGVEYTAPDKEMIKQMDLREPTQDGRIGLMVNRIYESSPAAAMGLTEGDILLTIAVPGTPWPIELGADGREGYDGPDFDEADIPKEFAAMGYRMSHRRPWPSRDNYLTGLLADIGRDTTVMLRYIHGTATLEKEFTIQQAPRDMLSAGKYKNDKLGLTVKDVTYEVRAALRLKADEPAVVVTRIEQGTAAALARINLFELIRAVDGTSVDSAETFEILIAKAQQAQKDSVRLTVEWMGKTRLADLKFDAKAPAEGLLNSLLQGR